MKIAFIFPLFIVFAPLARSATMLVTIDLTTSTGGLDNTAGDTLDVGAPFMFAIEGVTFVASATSILGDGTGVFNATTGEAGVNSGGGGAGIGDDASQIDNGESLIFTLFFGPSISEVIFTEIDFGAVGDNLDSAQVEFPDGLGGATSLTLSDGSADFSGSDIFTPASGISFQDGDAISFSNISEGSYTLQSFTFEVVTVPELSSLWLLGAGFPLLLRRKRVCAKTFR